jgi:hypothetical protein
LLVNPSVIICILSMELIRQRITSILASPVIFSNFLKLSEGLNPSVILLVFKILLVIASVLYVIVFKKIKEQYK